jgi:hypothetical protein
MSAVRVKEDILCHAAVSAFDGELN